MIFFIEVVLVDYMLNLYSFNIYVFMCVFYLRSDSVESGKVFKLGFIIGVFF